MNVQALCAAMEDGERWQKAFRLKTYSDAFQRYCAEYGAVYTQALEETGGRTGALNDLAASILETLEGNWKRRWIWNRAAAKADCRQMLVNYLSPMLLELEAPGSRELCALLRDGWAARWPRQAYKVVSHQRIQQGFRNAIMGIEIPARGEPPVEEDL